jgi:hypothetical protein
MLKTKPLQELLSQALSSSIHTAVLATPQGTLLVHASNIPSDAPSHSETPRRQARSLGALANVIWKSYANIRNIEDLWETANVTTSTTAESREGLLWTAVECDVRHEIITAN